MPNYQGQCVVQARQQQMQLARRRQRGERLRSNRVLTSSTISLLARPIWASLSKLNRLLSRLTLLTSSSLCIFGACMNIAPLIAVFALTFATTCCQNARVAPHNNLGSPHNNVGSRAQNIANHSSRQFRISSDSPQDCNSRSEL